SSPVGKPAPLSTCEPRLRSAGGNAQGNDSRTSEGRREDGAAAQARCPRPQQREDRGGRRAIAATLRPQQRLEPVRPVRLIAGSRELLDAYPKSQRNARCSSSLPL